VIGALDGIRVVDAGVLVQAPQAAALLGQLGASVTKVELPGFGDQSRWLPVTTGDPRSAFFAACNRGKRSITVDLRVAAGREVFLRLIDATDVLLTNFAPGTLERWALGYDVLAARNPGLVLGAGSAFGPTGPDAGREGADLSGQASGGLISATGDDGGNPTPIAVTIADHIASQNLVAGVLAALLARARTGRGQRIDVSLLGGQIWAQAGEYTAYLMTGTNPGRPNRGHPLIAGLYGIFPTADGWIAVVGVTPRQRDAFFNAVGRPDMLDDPRFPAGLLAPDQKAALFAELSTVFPAKSTAEWCAILRDAGQRYAPVRDYAAVAADPQAWVNGYFASDESGASIVGSPIRFSDTPARTGDAAPELGQHTEEVLLELGYSWDDIAALRDAGAI
jgi:crotonobetainyl-CoA:carnitine CoA-transferase CaiB-like acyl-CoA transferase